MDGNPPPGDVTDRDAELSVLGRKLEPCSFSPLTGFYRDGCCSTGPEDRGSHTVRAQVSEEFLAFSGSVGNDLSTPRPEWGFVGLRPGDSRSAPARPSRAPQLAQKRA